MLGVRGRGGGSLMLLVCLGEPLPQSFRTGGRQYWLICYAAQHDRNTQRACIRPEQVRRGGDDEADGQDPQSLTLHRQL